MTDPSQSALFAPLFSSAAMRGAVDDRARLQRMLDVESALAQADVGVIPKSAAGSIAAACHAEKFELAAIAAAAPAAGNVLIPLVKALTAAVAKDDPDAARYVHWGATSQDIIDTARVTWLRLYVRAIDSSVCERKHWCNLAAPPERSRRSANMALMLLGADQRITAHFSVREIEQLFDPLSYQGVSQTFIDRILAQAKIR